jgi:parvulin-like peptidyl-prolyl isomerase
MLMGRERKIKKLRREGILEPVKIDKKRANALKKIFLWTTSLLLAFIFVFGTWAYVVKDIQASVNGSRITTSNVEEMLDPIRRSMVQQGLDPYDESQKATINQYQAEIVEMLIDMKLFENYAQKNNISVPDNEIEERINKEINEIMSSYDNEEDFYKTLAGSELRTIERLREEIAKSLRPQLLEEKILGENFNEISITEEDAREFFESPSVINAQRLLLQVNFETASQEDIDLRDKEIRDIREKMLMEEISFERAIELHSEDLASKSNNGEMTLEEGSPALEPELFEIAREMELQEVSSIIKTEYGFSIIKVNNIAYQKQRYDVPESAVIKSMTLKPEEEAPVDSLNESIASPEEKALGLVNTIRQGKESFDLIADLYSISPATSKEEQTVYRGQMDPSKEAVIFNQLQPGQISDPIPSANTFEIIQLIGKKPLEIAVFENIKDQLIEEQIMRKKSEIRNQWIQEQKEKARISRSNAWVRISDFFNATFGGFFQDLGNWVRHYTVDPKPIPSDEGEMPFSFPQDGMFDESMFDESMFDFDETVSIPVSEEDIP